MNSNKQPIKLKKAKAWRTYLGGSMLRDLQGERNTEDDHFPEEWIMSFVSARNAGREDILDEGLSKIDSEEDKSLKDVILTDPSYFLGKEFVNKFGETTGVLIKLIDSSERLSVQVHPDREKAKKLFHSAFGKTECWHVLGGRRINNDDPCIFLGFKEGITQEKWKQLFDVQDIQGMLDCMHKIYVKPGETYLINSGVPHAIGAGCFLAEIQEPTDYTIRVEKITESGMRIDDRMCHQGIGFIKMFECFHYDGLSYQQAIDKWSIKKRIIEKRDSAVYESLIDYSDTEMFALYGLSIKSGEFDLKLNDIFSGIYVLEGSATMKCDDQSYSLNKSDQYFIPAGCKSLLFSESKDLRLLHFFGPKI
ncbi:MAG: hypothetical protein PQJ45_02045 [Sphaerochaetaceae bacterium]|nr:hypothetical protein [Sphaerochaetaceae bacterium]MDC7236539.1 hypothetical protein [Sphaerochaetaceae bacterium]